MNCARCGTKAAFTFVSERGAPFTVAGLGKLIERAGVAAKIGFKVHTHTAKTIPLAVVAGVLRSSAGANKPESGAHTDPDAPLHLARRPSIALSSWRRRRVHLLASPQFFERLARMPTARGTMARKRNV